MIDIIIPVYNTPKQDLLRCLDSINNQTYQDYLVTIIDDGSNETTANILDDYCHNHQRFTVKHIINGGVSNARNTGLETTNNEYLAFVDADDEVTPNFLEESLKLLIDNNLDMIVGGYQEIKDNEVKRTRLCAEGLHIYEGNDKEKYFDKLLSGKLCTDNKEIKDAPTGRIYARLYRRSKVKERFNRNIKISEDTLFVIDIMKNLNRIGVVDRIWYKYYQNPYSVVHQTIGINELNNLYNFMNEIYLRMLKEDNKRIKNAYKMRVFKTVSDLEDTIKNVDPTFLNREAFVNSFKDIDISNYINMKEKELNFYNRIKNKEI
jgi:glycosyltransferase involved in cell wall biosynthesis